MVVAARPHSFWPLLPDRFYDTISHRYDVSLPCRCRLPPQRESLSVACTPHLIFIIVPH